MKEFWKKLLRIVVPTQVHLDEIERQVNRNVKEAEAFLEKWRSNER